MRKQMVVLWLLPMLALLGFVACSGDPSALRPERQPAVYEPSAPVEVQMDVHGIPHIYGRTDADVFYGQGYMAAELRPAQHEVFRLRSQGRRAEVFGEDVLTEDMFVRAMDFVGFAESHWDELEATWPDLAEMATAFAAGFNKKYAEYRRDGWPMTLQTLIAAGYEPPDWTAIDVVTLAQFLGFGLAGSPDIELELSIIKALIGEALFQDLFRFKPPVGAVTVPDWFERLGYTAPEYEPFDKAAVVSAAPPASTAGTDLVTTPLAAALDGADLKQIRAALDALKHVRFGGSNAWAVAGSKMTDGVAVVESDTHQGLPIPGPYLLMHLISTRRGGRGQQDVIGATFPGAPLVVFGSNGHVAWSPTVGFSDVTDFYFEFSDPADRTRVLRPGGESIATTVRTETFKIRQNDGTFRFESVEVRDIPGHGPILPSELLPLPLPVKISVRWAGARVPGPAGAVKRLAESKTIDEMFAALGNFVGGTIGFMLGSTENRIAYSNWTLQPRRPMLEGPYRPWFIMPGTEPLHWDGFYPYEEVPFWIDPERGYLWTSNNDPAGGTLDNDPYNDPRYYGFAYALGYRGQRLDDLLAELSARGNIAMAELEAVQADRYSLFAEQLMPYFAAAVSRRADLMTPELDAVTAAVFAWDLKATADSFEATIFYTWVAQFIADTLLDDYSLIDEVSSSVMPIIVPALIHWLHTTKPILAEIDAGTRPFPSASGINLWDNRNTPGIETLDEQIVTALAKSVAHLKDVFARGASGSPEADPDDITTWHLGRILFLRSRHELAHVPAADRDYTQYDEYRPGAGHVDTVNVGQFVLYKDGKLLDRYILDNAPSNRFLWQMHSDGIRGKFQAPWGQSEIPEVAGAKNPLYLNYVDDYVAHVYRDFPFTEAEIAAAATGAVRLID